MSEAVDLARVYSAIEEASRLADAPCSREKVWPILTTYGDTLAKAVIAFRVATGERRAGDLDCRFTMLPTDPYALALSNDLTPKTDHPVGDLLSDLSDLFPVDCYGIDFGVVDGFKKTWLFFPPDELQSMPELADVPSMPPSMAENLDLFARHGLDNNASLIGIDYPSRTLNVYFGEIPPECFEPKVMISTLREIGLPDPSEHMLGLGEHAFGIYVTLGWDSPRIQRVTYAVMTPDPASLPTRLDPTIERFVKSAPYTYDAADRRFVYAVTSSNDGEYCKLQSYYQWRPHMLHLMLLADSAEGLE
ncbi:aromatic prenyltransferase [Phytohabitans suffuscus]